MRDKKKTSSRTRPLIVVCPDKFRGSLTSLQAGEAIQKGILRGFPQADVRVFPVSDGGEGTIDSFLFFSKGKRKRCKVAGPQGRKIQADYAIVPGKTAVVEMAEASGLWKSKNNNPLDSTSYGTGQLIADALASGCNRIILGIGGTASNDAGTGILAALGVRFLDKNHRVIDPVGKRLFDIEFIDKSAINPLLGKCNIRILHDVDNPFTGKTGASRIYSPQKGASPVEVELLEKGMEKFHRVIRREFGINLNKVPGSGSGGGAAGGLFAVLGAELVRGTDLLIREKSFRQAFTRADLVITGEGKVDAQTAFGKTVAGIAGLAAEYGTPVICLAGDVRTGVVENIAGIFSIVPGPVEFEDAMKNAGKYLARTAENAIRVFFSGSNHF